MALYLKPTRLPGNPADDYDVYDGDRVIGRIMFHPLTPKGRPWFWAVTARPRERASSLDDRGYAVTLEQAMADFKARWVGSE
jgi:hypothetical protein